MMIVRTVAELREVLRQRRNGSIGFVPTMGALHEGHLSLVRAARETSDTVVLSIFVNPTQFGDVTDLEAYPRTEDADVALASEAGVDVVFAPAAAEMYPSGFATTVAVHGVLVDSLEGAVRGRDHFDGVATVVAKLLLAVLPDTAYFGAKDAQQVVVVRRMVADLNIPVRIAVCETSRDADGLARSSRNARLSGHERRRALSLSRALFAMRDAAASGESDSAVLVAHGIDVLAHESVVPEYLEIVDADSLEAAPTLDRPLLVVLAARVGATRLIDNVLIAPKTT